MSLSCSAYTVNPDTRQMDESLGSWPVGGEVRRQTFYGSDAIKELGLTLIPSLSKGDIYAYGEDVLKLEYEVGVLIDRIDEVAEKLWALSQNLEDAKQDAIQRLNYIREAIVLAKATNGMVVIW